MIIGIGGISRAGKTVLSSKICEAFPGNSKLVLHQDDFIRAGYEMKQIGSQPDWEDPHSIDFPRLQHELNWAGYHLDLIIVEGLFAFFWEPINQLYDKKILIEVDFDTFLARKKADMRWGKTEDWYIRHIWESYQQKGVPVNDSDFLILDGNNPIDLKPVMSYVFGETGSEKAFGDTVQTDSSRAPFSHR